MGHGSAGPSSVAAGIAAAATAVRSGTLGRLIHTFAGITGTVHARNVGDGDVTRVTLRYRLP